MSYHQFWECIVSLLLTWCISVKQSFLIKRTIKFKKFLLLSWSMCSHCPSYHPVMLLSRIIFLCLSSPMLYKTNIENQLWLVIQWFHADSIPFHQLLMHAFHPVYTYTICVARMTGTCLSHCSILSFSSLNMSLQPFITVFVLLNYCFSIRHTLL